MHVSIFLAQLIGSFVFFIALAMLMHQARYRKVAMEMVSNATISTVMGMVGLLLGLILVLTHNIWVRDWPVVITVLGWLVVLGNLCRLIFPEIHTKFMKDCMAKRGYTVMSWVWLVIGAYLLWVGFAS
jgi:hypothetical protein